jgi:mercuric ion transport protein
MTEPPPTPKRFGLLGVAAAACVACCAGPLLALLGGLSIAGLASTAWLGGLGFVVATIACAGFIAVRRHRGACGQTDGSSVMVAAPTRKTATR